MGILLSVVAVVGASFGAGPYEQIIVYRNGKELLVRSSFSMEQDMVIRTHYRENSYLVNGTEPLPDATEVTCDFLDHVVDYEIVMPEYRVEMFKNKPGIEHDFLAPELPGLLNVRNVFRYQARNACVVYIKNTVLCDMAGFFTSRRILT